MNGGALKDQQVFQRELGEQVLALRSARLLVHDLFGHTVDRLATGEPMNKPMQDDLMACVAYMTQVCQQATHFAYTAAGSQGLRNPSLVQRCFRDMYTGGQHIFVDRKSYEELATNHLTPSGAGVE
jgi:alkylation response protein AidB-like acyl-CoA dehydrogenase